MQIMIIVVFRHSYTLHFYTKSYVAEFIAEFIVKFILDNLLDTQLLACRVVMGAWKLK